MSGELIPSGGAVVPAGTGGAVGEHIGDVSLDRGVGAPTAEGAAVSTRVARQARDMRLHFEPLIARLGLNDAQKRIVDNQLRSGWERRFALDTEERDEVEAELRDKWGDDAYQGNIQAVIEFLIDVCGPAYGRMMDARDPTGRVVANDAGLLEAILAFAHKVKDLERAAREGARRPNGTPPPDPPDPAVRQSARRRELKEWLDTNDPRYWKSEPAKVEYLDLLRKEGLSDAPVPDGELEQRIATIESWIGSPRYSRDEAIQAELRELYDRREQLKRRQ